MDTVFSSPLSSPTTLLKFGVGAGKTNVRGLGYVNFDDLSVEGGAASCLLDFSGSGLQTGSVRLSTAMASVEIRIPEGLPAEITSENVLGRPLADAGFTRRGSAWCNQAALQKPSQLRIRSTIVMGRLQLNTIT